MAIFWDYTRNTKIPREVFLNTQSQYYFSCYKCSHLLLISLGGINRGCWCQYCAGYVCGNTNCTICEKQCDIALCIRKAKKQTRVKKLNLCKECYNRCITEDPAEAPIQRRAKISLEIYTLAELQRQAMNDMDSFLISEPTVWDCPILPGENFKPDNMWCFDKYGNIFTTSGACKIETQEISYVLLLEVIEHGIKQHSDARNIPDDIRELAIRNVFTPQPVGVLYVTMAHILHETADKEDIFFMKKPDTTEYSLIPGRENAWQHRIFLVKEKLLEMYYNRSNETFHIGK